MVQMNLSTKQKQTHRHRKQTCGCQGGGGGSGMNWEFGVSRCKLLHLEGISNEVLRYSTGNSIQSPGIDHDRKLEIKNKIYFLFFIYFCLFRAALVMICTVSRVGVESEL